MGNVATESSLVMEAVQKVIGRIYETQKEYKEAEMRLKLKKCQGVRVRDYEHQG